jgi:predicted nucleic acid-binding protein
MTERVYLDTSALVKRYLKEEGSEKMDSLFNESYGKSVVLVMSQWNIGEAAVVFDKYQNRKVIRDARQPFQSLYSEVSLLAGLGQLEAVPVLGEIIAASIPLVLAYHVYLADALQIETCRHQGCGVFVAFDERLNKVAEREGMKLA